MNISHSFKRLLPNFFTFGNMMCGFLSVVASHQGNFSMAAWLIGIAAVADALDGTMARLTKTSSPFGVELDSLADVISFGFAPSFLIYTSELFKVPTWGLLASSVFLFAGGFRLARFNTELIGFSKEYFNGLPIPTAAIALTSFVYLRLNGTITDGYPVYLTIGLVLSLAFLMASHIKYDTLPLLTPEGLKKKPVLSLFLAFSLIAVLVSQGKVLFYVFILFILFGIFRHIFLLLKGANKKSV